MTPWIALDGAWQFRKLPRLYLQSLLGRKEQQIMRAPNWSLPGLIVLVGILSFTAPCFAQNGSGEPSLDSSSDPTAVADPSESEIRATSFQQVTPGETGLAELHDRLKYPTGKQVDDDTTILEYQIQPFQKVEVSVSDDVVTSIVIHLKEARSAEDVSAELGLSDLVATPIRDDAGDILGEAYPERGVLFSYERASQDPLVAQIVLEPISPDAFWLRFENTPHAKIAEKLQDLQHILELDPDSSEAFWHRAEILGKAGYYEEAVAAAENSINLVSTDGRYVLTHAKLQAEIRDHAAAIEATKTVVRSSNLPGVRSRALCQLGDLLASGKNPDLNGAVKHHLAAIKLATPLAASRNQGVQYAAQQTLINAHLGVANGIVRGNFERKQEVSQKWLNTARELADRFVAEAGHDQLLKLVVYRRTLEAVADLGGDLDGQAPFNASVELGRQLMESSDDLFYRQQLKNELLQITFAKTRIAQLRREYEQALAHAQAAIALLEDLPPEHTSRPTIRYLSGRLFYYIGAIHAMHHDDHKKAVRWYEKARPHLHDLPPSAEADRGLQSERLVSMGASYWKTGVRDDAFDLTKQGVTMMHQARMLGLIEARALSVGYNNLAEMYRANGETDKAREFADKADRLAQGDATTATR